MRTGSSAANDVLKEILRQEARLGQIHESLHVTKLSIPPTTSAFWASTEPDILLREISHSFPMISHLDVRSYYNATHRVAEAMRTNSTVSHLNLEDVSMIPADLGFVAEMLEHNHRLESLALGGALVGLQRVARASRLPRRLSLWQEQTMDYSKMLGIRVRSVEVFGEQPLLFQRPVNSSKCCLAALRDLLS